MSKPCEAMRYWTITIRERRDLGPAPLPTGVRIVHGLGCAKFSDGSWVLWDATTGEMLRFDTKPVTLTAA